MSKIHDPLLDKEHDIYEGGTLSSGWTVKDLKKISNLDNQHGDGAGPRTSSTIIMDEFGGVQGLIEGLQSDEAKGIDPKTIQ